MSDIFRSRLMIVLGRIGLLLVVMLASFALSGAGLFHVASDEIAVIHYRTGAKRLRQFGYVAEPGWYLGDPFAEISKIKIGFHQPSTKDYLRAMREVDALRDEALEELGVHNPTTKEGVKAQAEVVTVYINRRTSEIGRPVALDGIEFFDPPKGSGRYDVELAHFDYLARTMRYNMISVRQMQKEDTSLLSITTHELAHSALNVFTGEQLCQLLTLQALYDMKQGGVDGAEFAFWDELRDWFLFTLRFRVHFNHGWFPLGVQESYAFGERLRVLRASSASASRTWHTHASPQAYPLVHAWKTALRTLKGNPFYENEVVELADIPTSQMGIWLIEKKYDARAHGIRFIPGRLLFRAGLPIPVIRSLLGARYWHKEVVLYRGEDEVLRKAEVELLAGESRHLKERAQQMQDNPIYFAHVWWDYLVGPLHLIENQMAAGRGVEYYAITKDINEMSYGEFAATLDYGINTKFRRMQFEDVGPLIYKLLDLKPAPIVVRPAEDEPYKVVNFWYYVPQEPPVKPFPGVPLAMLLLLCLEKRLRRLHRRLRDFCDGLYRSLGVVPFPYETGIPDHEGAEWRQY